MIAGYREVSAQPLNLGAPHGAAAHRLAKRRVAHVRELRDRSHVPCRAGLPGGIVGGGRDGIPRTDFLTDVAAVHMRSKAPAKRVRYGASKLDREVGNASRRIEDAWCDERLGRARFE